MFGIFLLRQSADRTLFKFSPLIQALCASFNLNNFTRAVLRLAFENNMEREAVLSVTLAGACPKSTYIIKRLLGLCNARYNVSTEAFEKMIFVYRCVLWPKS